MWTEHRRPATKVGSVNRTGATTRSTIGQPAALESARYFYYWRFS